MPPTKRELRPDLRVGSEQLITPAIKRAIYDGALQKKVMRLQSSTHLNGLDIPDGLGQHLQASRVLK